MVDVKRIRASVSAVAPRIAASWCHSSENKKLARGWGWGEEKKKKSDGKNHRNWRALPVPRHKGVNVYLPVSPGHFVSNSASEKMSLTKRTRKPGTPTPSPRPPPHFA